MDVIANELGIRFDSGLYKGIAAKGGLLELAAPIFTRVWRRSRSRSLRAACVNMPVESLLCALLGRMAAMRYDPARPVDAEEWSQLDEGEQIELVMEHHRPARIRLPNLRVHASLHVTVENQVLLGEETPVAAALLRLMGEGLGRHDAIHAIASVLSRVMYDAVTRNETRDLKTVYYSEVDRLTAEGWRSQADQT